MGTPHIKAEKGQIAELVLLPGDPLRAKFIAENYLENSLCYNKVRGMLGYTGYYKGKRVSVQGTGMGMPSISIYTHELINQFGAKRLLRIGTCGSIQKDLNLRDVVIAISASTDSAINNLRFNGRNYAATADAELLFTAWETSKKLNINAKAGNILTSDVFYDDDPNFWKVWADYGILCIEMETAALYTIAAKNKVQALTILTVSDNIVSGDHCTAEEREVSFKQMMGLALETI
ncbi:MAG: purine-nucleoside phosphorylase [Candidatus Cloacimonetes bacterium]|nr:purine-nucleoside phosphorylase [Candidatus Cloacimonadota bacterium]